MKARQVEADEHALLQAIAYLFAEVWADESNRCEVGVAEFPIAKLENAASDIKGIGVRLFACFDDDRKLQAAIIARPGATGAFCCRPEYFKEAMKALLLEVHRVVGMRVSAPVENSAIRAALVDVLPGLKVAENNRIRYEE